MLGLKIKMVERKLKYTEAVREAIDQSMEKDSSVFIIGLGVPDPKGIFGTTLGLKENSELFLVFLRSVLPKRL